MSALILVNGEVRDECIQPGMQALRQGAPAIDVAELVARAVESDAGDHSVGFSGLPNILGEVELDASIMDGATLASGAVSALKGYLHPVSVARQVMERLPHVLLTDAGAARFAAEINAEAGDLLTPEAKAIYLKRLNAVGRDWGLEIRDWRLEIGDWSEISNLQSLISSSNVPLIDLVARAIRYHEGGDTMNIIVRDGAGRLVSAVTTSGVAWKYPGRVGDSPIIGAGSYADDRHGAATCTGMGELTIRHGTALRAVLALSYGKSIDEAGRETIRDLRRMSGARDAWVRLLLVDKNGAVGGYCTRPGATLKVQTIDENRPRVIESEHVAE
ncbi:MAG: isoaspartyl peptidase/L-asparaginase [Chloroflexi bacterium]|nr:isoaspartyl peptidase/L-asparaginase [Chloroflexota bacterium]MCL5275342.1 isoaspartyl peptidase/L-asparaginase [Chloroflexota bacterium]